jgi:hypothetical protein
VRGCGRRRPRRTLSYATQLPKKYSSSSFSHLLTRTFTCQTGRPFPSQLVSHRKPVGGRTHIAVHLWKL